MKELRVESLVNSRDTELKILNFGASVLSLKLSCESGPVNIVVGPEDPSDFLTDEYREKGKFFGASVGRYAGRISKGGFFLQDRHYPLYSQDGVHLHGGKKGFSYRFWKVEEVSKGPDPSVLLSYLSPHMEEGYPGNLQVWVKYTLTEADEVQVEYTAETDQETIINLTNHTYFNLNGFGDVCGHQLKLNADQDLEVDHRLAPTGKFSRVTDTEKDFRRLKSVDEIPLDNIFMLNSGLEGEEKITLLGEISGISLSIETNQPAVVVYVPENLPENWRYNTEISSRRPAICLETQKCPDAPHWPEFPSVVLKPGEQYRNSSRWILTRVT